jgi:protein tyrosine phosphatase
MLDRVSAFRLPQSFVRDVFVGAPPFIASQVCRREFISKHHFIPMITSQGPPPSTHGHFWLMVVETGVRIIVMTTNILEKNVVKCGQYWPDLGTDLVCPTDLFTVVVSLVQEDVGLAWSRRLFRVTKQEKGKPDTTAEVSVSHSFSLFLIPFVSHFIC